MLTRRATRDARVAAAALLLEPPGEIVAHILKHCAVSDLCSLVATCRRLHPIIEIALRLRATEGGHTLPTPSTSGDDDCCRRRVQQLLHLEWRRMQLSRRTIAAGMSHSLFISPAGALLSCGTEWDVDGNPTPGLLGHGELAEEDVPANSVHVPTPIPSLRGTRIRSVAAGVSLSLAVTEAGEVYSWGQGNMGQLGHGWTTQSQSTPRRILALTVSSTNRTAQEHKLPVALGRRSVFSCHGKMPRYASCDRYYSVTLRFLTYNKTSCLWGHPDFSSVLVMLRSRLLLPPSLPSLTTGTTQGPALGNTAAHKVPTRLSLGSHSPPRG